MNPLPADGQDGVHTPQGAVKVDVGDGGNQSPAIDDQARQPASSKLLVIGKLLIIGRFKT